MRGQRANLNHLGYGVPQLIGHEQMPHGGHIRTAQVESLREHFFQLGVAELRPICSSVTMARVALCRPCRSVMRCQNSS